MKFILIITRHTFKFAGSLDILQLEVAWCLFSLFSSCSKGWWECGSCSGLHITSGPDDLMLPANPSQVSSDAQRLTFLHQGHHHRQTNREGERVSQLGFWQKINSASNINNGYVNLIRHSFGLSAVALESTFSSSGVLYPEYRPPNNKVIAPATTIQGQVYLNGVFT